ncbi:hypothetical protein [Pseudomonas prosekii]|uniref:Uncharacterized protein n=1 Tax=Pseudomonas prosekii TaxID=1148509 RepID=A0A1H2B3R9_9PSED|nr:hypothetical protein [Pseudomonas prosekii]SDT52851.1 hypothetical protein SAMN05216222_4901 [Pseudomonas prosekii]
MNRIAPALAALAFSSLALADPVVDAFDAALASAKTTITLQRACEVSIQSSDVKPCMEASTAHEDYERKTRHMLSIIGPPPDGLYQHVRPEQGAELVNLANEIKASMDMLVKYTDPK